MTALRGRSILLGFFFLSAASCFKLHQGGSVGNSTELKATNASLLSQPVGNASATATSGEKEAKRLQIANSGPKEGGRKPANSTHNATQSGEGGGSFGFDVSKMSVSEFWEPYMWVVAAIAGLFAVGFELYHRRLADVDLTDTPDCGAEHHEQQMLQLFRGILPLVRPFYLGHERRTAWAYLAAISALGTIDLVLGLVIMVWSKEFWDTIEKKNLSRFFPLILDLVLLAFSKIILSTYCQYISMMLSIRWRRSMTQWLLTKWLKDKCFYTLQLSANSDVPDNPDQRIQEDVRLFVEYASEPMLLLLSPTYAFGQLEAYPARQKVGQRLIVINFGLQKYEVRDNAESIALYGSEPCEEKRLRGKFEWIERVWWMMMSYTKRLGFFVSFYYQTSSIFPYLVLAPNYFRGQITLGTMFMLFDVLWAVKSGFDWFLGSYSELTGYRATVDRLSNFTRALDGSSSKCEVKRSLVPGLNVLKWCPRYERPAEAAKGTDAAARVSGLSVQLPGKVDQRRPQRAAALEGCASGSEARFVLLSAPEGTGKSCFFRAMAGIWPHASGDVHLPDKTLFLPQKSYIPQGTLKQAVAYPSCATEFTDADVQAALEANPEFILFF
ncbi:unnamed protein product [Symbiodinium pilosum]|uniref:ABC transmembrane type-1 domain-containing protein n=1 Tax=Symbiodinium pilosum TaxID=2952 RepID=A0A812UV89_SYMPI|nr:unnamed protein product [Symbiodinium pilosum]